MWQRFRNRFSALGSIPGLLGLGMALLGDFLPNTGWTWVTPLLAQVISIIGFCFIVSAVVLVIIGFIKTPAPKSVVNKYQPLYEISSILRRMDRYLWGIADGYTIQNVNMEKFGQLGKKSKELLKLKSVTLDPKKSLDEWIKKTKNVFSQDAKAIKQQMASSDLDSLNKLMVALTHLIDDEGYGLKKEKSADKRYNKFKKNIDEYHDRYSSLIDPWLSYLIHLHIHMSEYFADGFLVLKRSNWISEKTKIPTVTELAGTEAQANLADLENDSNERLNEIRNQISAHIQELENGLKLEEAVTVGV